MKTIVITGCAGFIGSWICDKAIAAGYKVIGLDNLSSGVNYTPAEVEFYNVDINSDISQILSQADVIIHAAAKAELRNNWKDKSERDQLFINNEMATRNILECMPDVPIIFLSTAAVYGSQSYNKICSLKEEDANPEMIESPYAASKLACEAYIAAWAHKKKIPWYALRLVNQVGPRTHRGVITDFLKMVQTNKHIHAADNGAQTKNWVSVEDTADLIMYLLNKKNKAPSGIYTVTSDERWSWRDFVNLMYNMYHEKYPNADSPFSLTYESCLAGSIGDPINLSVSGDKLKPYYSCTKSVEQSVRDALTFLGWVK